MNLRPQVQLRFRNIPQFLRIKELASSAGLSVNEWILRQIENGKGSLTGKTPPDGAEVTRSSRVPTPSSLPGHVVTVRQRDENSVPASCPDCGELLVWNKMLKRWVCECGYQGKVGAR